jgi:hypothetical protein
MRWLQAGFSATVQHIFTRQHYPGTYRQTSVAEVWLTDEENKPTTVLDAAETATQGCGVRLHETVKKASFDSAGDVAPTCHPPPDLR